jgi:hypothetical protein
MRTERIEPGHYRTGDGRFEIRGEASQWFIAANDEAAAAALRETAHLRGYARLGDAEAWIFGSVYPHLREAEEAERQERPEDNAGTKMWSRATTKDRWHPSIHRPMAATEEAVAACTEHPETKVRWFLVEDPRYGHLYEFKNNADGTFTALNWPLTKAAGTS